MKKKIYRLLMGTAALVFLISGAWLYFIWNGYEKASTEYDRLVEDNVRMMPAAESSGFSVKNKEDYVLQIDFTALVKENADIIGWIDIPGTTVSYPVVQSEDNEFYLTQSIYGERSSSGAIFMDYRNERDLSDDNTILYGHNMKNGSMFGGLKQYREEDFFKEHPYVDYYTPEGRHRFVIYAVYEEEAVSENFPVKFEDEKSQSSWFEEGMKKTWQKPFIIPGVDQHTIMLSTCTGRGYDKRFVVRAVESE